jgi:ABC-type nitrate/sulfonate/bicarbonate transport system permease component
MLILKQNGKLLLLVTAVILLGWIILTLSVPRTAAGPQAVQTFDLSWNAVANGGTTMSSSSYTLLSTSGQPVTGESAGAGYTLISGYWTGLRTFISEIFLPIVRGV